MKLTTKHLSCEHGIVSILNLDDEDNAICGKISPSGRRSTCLWPMYLGQEPAWFQFEVDQLMERFQLERKRLSRDIQDYPSPTKEGLLRPKDEE